MVKIASKASSPVWQAAMARALVHYAKGVRAERVGNRLYQVASATTKGQVYTVVVANPSMLDARCDCPCGRHPERPGKCYHAVLALCAETERVSNVERRVRRLTSR